MKIKIERENVDVVRVAGQLFKVGTLYYCKGGPHQHHAYYLTKIFKNLEGEWMFKIGEHTYDTPAAISHLDYEEPAHYRKCECGFLCEGYVEKGWTW